MPNEELESFKVKSDDAKHLAAELKAGVHGDFTRKGISWKVIQSSNPIYSKYKPTSFANGGRSICNILVTEATAKKTSDKKKRDEANKTGKIRTEIFVIHA